MTVTQPKSLEINYIKSSDLIEETIEELNGKRQYHWRIKDISPVRKEPYSGSLFNQFEHVRLAPSDVNYNGYKGSFKDWNAYGSWIYQLLDQRNNLVSVDFIALDRLIENCNTDIEKVRACYEYMREHTRYVYIGSGISGYQPAKSGDVHSNGYGDCKGLSHYMKSLLDHVDISSYYAEIGNGLHKDDLDTEFTSVNQTNHAILFVPLEKDSIWLECTSSNYPAGYIGIGNSNRHALLVTPEGGQLCKTPRITGQDNSRRTKSSIILNQDGSANFISRSERRNGEYEKLLGLLDLSEREQKDVVVDSFDSHSVNIESVDLKIENDTLPVGQITIQGVVTNFGKKVGSKVLCSLDFMYKSGLSSSVLKERSDELVVNYGYQHEDQIEIILPKGYAVYKHPEAVQISCELGEHEISFEKTADALVVHRTLTINRGVYDLQHKLDSFEEFLTGIEQYDNQKIIYLKE